MRPTISIVTCSYQQGRFLDSTIRSVIGQGYERLEYLVIDGGSTDESVDVIQRYEASIGYWVSERDGGQTDALRKGFGRATGDILGWLCSDDLLLPGSLERVADYFEAHPHVMVAFGDALWIDVRGKLIRPKKEMGFSPFVFYCDHNFVPQPSMFWRRSLYEKVGGLDGQFNLAMDSDLWSRFERVASIGRIPGYLSCMRRYPEQKTQSLKPQGRREDELLRRRYLDEQWFGFVPDPVLRGSARVARIFAKALAGGYGARVPASVEAALVEFEVA